ncbi:Spo0B C-terminal domain-containing protein [Bacillus sp. REN10]|uniref:Spo0B C-terminal domain-containing protein n=1 Tax=Bacillus sp. REN10 TaxID=2782541 RepID=UPI001EEF460F|nr:Spo0B C-terminal domain-containing protein [Bacillus sp. REN10]
MMKNEDWTVIQAMRHARHDWMNQLQLIKGFMALGKLEEAERVIETTILQARQEAHLCNLCLPKFAEKLLTFNWEEHSFQLEYEVLDHEICVNINDEWLSEWVGSLFHLIEAHIERYADNLLCLSIHKADEGLRFFFEFSGIIQNEHGLLECVEAQLNTPYIQQWNIHEYSSKELLFEVVL